MPALNIWGAEFTELDALAKEPAFTAGSSYVALTTGYDRAKHEDGATRRLAQGPNLLRLFHGRPLWRPRACDAALKRSRRGALAQTMQFEEKS